MKNVNIIISIREADNRFLASFNNGPNRVFRTPYEILEAIGEEVDQLAIQHLLKIDPGKPFVKDEAGVVDEHLFKRKKEVKKSNLLYPITVLESERDNCGHLSGSLVAQLNKAIDILNDERYKIAKKTFRDSLGIKDDIGKKFKERRRGVKNVKP